MVDPPEVPWRRLGEQQLFVRRIEDSSRRMRGMNPPEAKRVIRRLVVCASTILLTFSSIMHTVVIKPVGGSNEEERLVADGRWPDLVLFVPVFPGGEKELNEVLLRSLAFFWPKPHLKLLFLVDAEVAERKNFTKRLEKKASQFCSSASVAFNSISENVFGGSGWHRQQLIMLWADNFTDSAYVGFVDDDTIITNHVLYEDLFDEDGRPVVIGRSTDGTSTRSDDKFWSKQVPAGTAWAYGGQKEVMRTMNYFPVIVKTDHFKYIREAMLSHHPDFNCFDDFYVSLRKRGAYSQFNLMHQYLWHHKRDEYSWHLQATAANDETFWHIDNASGNFTDPKPRISLHLNYDNRKNEMGNEHFIADVLRRGFCYSLTTEEFVGDYGLKCSMAGYDWSDVTNKTDIDQWVFEYNDWRWDNRTLLAHKNRHALNRKKQDWNVEEINLLFN